MSSFMPPICVDCKHYNRDENRTKLSCKAFPDGIPEEILERKVVHVQPYPGDKGILFEPID